MPKLTGANFATLVEDGFREEVGYIGKPRKSNLSFHRARENVRIERKLTLFL